MEAVKQTTDLEKLAAEDVLRHAEQSHGDGFTIACSFGAEDVALVHMATEVLESPRFFTLDTGRLHEETHRCMDALRERYGARFEVYHPQAEAVEQLVSTKGAFSFRESVENRKECCAVRKLEPLGRALEGKTAWVTGLRREQSVTRTVVSKHEWDAGNGLEKYAPLADWTSARLWEYIRANDIPYNELHDHMMPSIGCAPCTRAIKAWEDERAGRWWWEQPEKRECGLHFK